jgi:hypothetical protein
MKFKTMTFKNKPKWEELPAQAKFIAMDEDGTWGWFATRPRPLVYAGCWYRGIEGETLFNRPKAPSKNWIKSLEEKPI